MSKILFILIGLFNISYRPEIKSKPKPLRLAVNPKVTIMESNQLRHIAGIFIFYFYIYNIYKCIYYFIVKLQGILIQQLISFQVKISSLLALWGLQEKNFPTVLYAYIYMYICKCNYVNIHNHICDLNNECFPRKIIFV